MHGDRIGGPIRWKLHLPASPVRVYAALDSAQERAGYWAESAEEIDGVIAFEFINGERYSSKVLEREPPFRWVIDYFGARVGFDLADDGAGGCDLCMTCENARDELWQDFHAGWLNVLLPMKAWIVHGVDIRNHDATRSWDQGYADQ